MDKLLYVLDICIPRFIDDEVALQDVGDHMEIVCSMKDVQNGESFDGIATMRGFNLFGFMLFNKMVGEVRPFKK